jgi:hypothetical protein
MVQRDGKMVKEKIGWGVVNKVVGPAVSADCGRRRVLTIAVGPVRKRLTSPVFETATVWLSNPFAVSAPALSQHSL